MIDFVIDLTLRVLQFSVWCLATGTILALTFCVDPGEPREFYGAFVFMGWLVWFRYFGNYGDLPAYGSWHPWDPYGR